MPLPNIGPFLAREDGPSLDDDYIRRVVGLAPAAHTEANNDQFEQLLAQTNDVAFLKAMLRQLRRDLQGAQFAARINHDTIVEIRRPRG